MKRGRLLSAAGFSIVELMVALGVGLVVVLAVTGMVARNESTKRATTSTNDVNQTGNYVAYLLDKSTRSAGSGFVQRWREAYGCEIRAADNGTQVLPRPAAFPAPFASVPQLMRLAPLVIFENAGPAQSGVTVQSDVLAVMAGSAGFSESGTYTLASLTPPSTSVRLQNNLGYRADDVVLLASAGMPCMVEQVAPSPTFPADPIAHPDLQTLPFSGRYAAPSVAGSQVSDYSSAVSVAMALGNMNLTSPNSPQFQLFGVSNTRALMSLDILTQNATPNSIADGVTVMKALYGISSTGGHTVDQWVSPGTSPYTAAELLAGTPAATTNLTHILAVRIGMVLESSLTERDQVYERQGSVTARDAAHEDLTLFPDAVPEIVTLSGDELRRRHRVIDVTIPLRNPLLW